MSQLTRAMAEFCARAAFRQHFGHLDPDNSSVEVSEGGEHSVFTPGWTAFMDEARETLLAEAAKKGKP